MNKNMLVITNGFPNKNNSYYGGIFVKEQLYDISRHFNKIFVFSPKPYYLRYMTLKDYSYSNINVYFSRFFYLPLNYFRRRLAKEYFKIIKKAITQKKINFDIIHAHFIWPSGVAGVYIKEKFKKPLVITVHGHDIRAPLTDKIKMHNKGYIREQIKKAIKFADLIISHHEELYDLLIKEFPQFKSKIKFIYKGVPLDKFVRSREVCEKAKSYREKLKIKEKFIVLYLARVEKEKGANVFIEASKILNKNKDIIFLMVGDGKLLNEVKKFKKKNKLDNILIVGNKVDRWNWYAMSDVFVALSPLENIWSTTLQEALVMGVPTITTRVGYTKTKLIDGIDTIMIPPDDPYSLANAILRLKNDYKLRKKLSKKVGYWRNIFDNKKIAKKIVKEIQKLS